MLWKSNKYYIFWVCIFRLTHPACKSCVPHCHTWTVWLYKNFSTLSNKQHDFGGGKKVTGHKMRVLIFCTTFVRNISHSKHKWARYDQKCILVFMYGVRDPCNILMKLENSPQIFQKIHKYQIVCFLLGNYPASGFYMPTFRNTLSVPSS